MSPSLQQFQLFCAVARNLSFSQAAREMYTSQPHVSNQISRLENHYKIPLFIRSQPRIALTDAGRELHRRVEAILDDIDQVEQLARQFQGLRRGLVRVGATASAGNHLMPRLVSTFNRAHPEIVVSLRVGNTDDVFSWLWGDEVELTVSPLLPGSTNLHSEKLYEEPLVVICPANMELPEPLSVQRMRNLPMVAREDGSATLRRMWELLGLDDDHDGIVARLTGTTAVNEAVAAGLGVSLVPEYSAGPWLRSGVVRRHTVNGVSARHDFHLSRRRGHDFTPAVHAFVAHMRDAVRVSDVAA